jgi:predicted amidophosphoribosyltransferase
MDLPRRLAPFLDLLFPPRCVVAGCGRRGAWWCAACRARVQPVAWPSCRRCGAPGVTGRCPDCALIRPAFERAVAGGSYVPPLSSAIRALKYGRAEALAAELGGWAAAALDREAPGLAVDLVLAVPPHRSRVAARGLDHAAALARAVAEARRRPWRPGLLRRERATRPQVGLARAERRENVAGAFAVAGPLAGERVLVVDDVLTTGATASACAAALAAAGAGPVVVLTVARAGRPWAGPGQGAGL